MNKLMVAFLAVILFVALPAFGQEKEAVKKPMTKDKAKMEMDKGQEAHMVPQPLDNEWANWMIGEWKGWSDGPMGKTEEWEKIEKGLDGQFLMHDARSKMADGTEYHGLGATTIQPKTGKVVGYWIDNMRGMYAGEGTKEGDTVTTSWKGYQGNFTRTMEKTGENSFKGTWKFEDPAGNAVEGTFEMTRVTGAEKMKEMKKMDMKKEMKKDANQE